MKAVQTWLNPDQNNTWQYKAYYYPYIIHGLGLDIHDVGGHRDGGQVYAAAVRDCCYPIYCGILLFIDIKSPGSYIL